jgi:histidinol dehydrogenase
MVAGPSELMVIADGNGRADYIAADMLSQAEHGSGHEHSILVTTSQDLVKKVKTHLRKQAKILSRRNTVNKVMRDGMFFILVKSLEQAAEIASIYAPEHLEIMCSQAGNVAKKVTAAGAVFIGNYTPEAVGDFLAGPSHVLPTAGSAKYFTGLSVYSFFRRTSIINYQRPALHKELDMIECFAEMEGLDAHGKSAKIRFNEE